MAIPGTYGPGAADGQPPDPRLFANWRDFATALSRFYASQVKGQQGVQPSPVLLQHTDTSSGDARASVDGLVMFDPVLERLVFSVGGVWLPLAAGSDDLWNYEALANDSVVSVTTLTDVPDLAFTAAPNTTYEVELFGAFQTAATTTGIGLAFSAPTGCAVVGMTLAPSSNTALQATQQRAAGATLAPTTGVATASQLFPLWGKYIVICGSTGGAVQLQQRSEVAASATTIIAQTRLKWRTI